MALDFSDITPLPDPTRRSLGGAEREELCAELLARLESVLIILSPMGKRRRGKFLIGDVLGGPGDSLEVVFDDKKTGLWTDRATGDGGDVYALIAAYLSTNVSGDFPRVLNATIGPVGRSRSAPVRKASKKDVPVNELGPATAKWDYFDAQDHLIAIAHRYDPPGQKKQFRPWDAKWHKMAPPDPCPLYSQSRTTSIAQVVLVEGEKCVQVLIDAGIVATTMIHDANAPVEKTGQSPPSRKAVLIWPNHDKPGREYTTQAAQAILSVGAKPCHVFYPPEEAAEGWDVADTIAEDFDVIIFLTHEPRLQVHGVADDVDPVVSSDKSVQGTEGALVLFLTRRYHRDWRHVVGQDKWLVWDGQRWRIEDTLTATDLIRNVCRQTAVHADNPKVTAKLASAGMVGNVGCLARTDRRHAAAIDGWDVGPWLPSVPGGVVDPKTDRMRTHGCINRMTKITTAMPSGDYPTWRQFIDEVTGGDQELQSYPQRMIGCALTGSAQEHALFFPYDTDANNKSVFVNTLATILHDYATNAPIDTFMETRTDRHPIDMARLRGACFAAVIETGQGKRQAESKLKNPTGGDKISARFMRQDFFEFFPQFKLLVTDNHRPAVHSIDEAMKRRLHLIPFTITVPPGRRDKNLQRKPLTERDGILAQAVQGCLDWQRHGRLSSPRCVVDTTEEYFEAEDTLGRWLGERYVHKPSAKSLTTELFNDWRQWAEASGEFVGAQRRLFDLLITRGLGKWRNGMGVRGFQGIDLKYPPIPAYTPYADN